VESGRRDAETNLNAEKCARKWFQRIWVEIKRWHEIRFVMKFWRKLKKLQICLNTVVTCNEIWPVQYDPEKSVIACNGKLLHLRNEIKLKCRC
jgi:hypothetical protein